MVAKSFEVGDLVWAKMKGYPPWPGKIIDPPEEAKLPKVKKAHHYVFFYGSKNHAWIQDENIYLHNESLVQQYTAKKRPADFLSAVETIVNASKSSTKYQKQQREGNFEAQVDEDTPESHESSFEKIQEASPPKSKSPHANNVTRKKVSPKKISVSKKVTKRVARKRAPSPDRDSLENEIFTLFPKAPRIDEVYQEMSHRIDEEYADLFANIPPNIGYNPDAHQSPSGLLSRGGNYIEHIEPPPIDLSSVNEILKDKGVEATTKKIGFVGLGKLGQGIVKNLIQSGHSVTVWNRTTDKCHAFIKIGADSAPTPADVILASDITFCCVSDLEASKALFFGNCGIMKGLENSSSGKGYVEMTSIDPKTSEAIAEHVRIKGGRYLEAPISGSRVQAVEGTLLVLAAGDKSLYDDCRSCFQAISRHFLFMSDTVGYACQLSIIHSMVVGTVYAALAESLALVKRIKLDQNDFLSILQYGVLDSSIIIEKGHSMMQRNYISNTPLKHLQKDISLGLMLGSMVEQPMPITAAANEVYKHCKLMRYSDHDVSAVYEGTSGTAE